MNGTPTIVETAAPETADLDAVVKDVLVGLLRDGGTAVREELAKPMTGGGGGGRMDRLALGVATLALASVLGFIVFHELGNSKFETAILGLIDVLERHHPEVRVEVRDVERKMRD